MSNPYIKTHSIESAYVLARYIWLELYNQSVRVCVLQSNYFPWRGYFSLIATVDLFVFHDDLQYTKGDWRNRNVFSRNGKNVWLSVPCGTSEKRKICDVQLPDNSWNIDHHSSLREWYSKSAFFKSHVKFLDEVYLLNKFEFLSDFNQHWIKYISSEFLNLDTKFSDSREFNLQGAKFDRLLDLLKKVGATEYVSGPSAREYIREKDLTDSGIALRYIDYAKLPPVESGSDKFSILHDLLTYGDIRERVSKL